MCGIWALFGYDRNTTDCDCRFENCMKVKHRGPDQSRIETISGIKHSMLGFHRLTLVGHDSGMQPMQLKQLEHLVLCYNGEIYNYKLVQKQFGFGYETDCDGEAILHLYAHGGIEFAASQLDGVFAFILVDKAKKKVYLGRDTYGVRPAFRILTDSGCLAVCSEAKGITKLFDKENAEKCAPMPPGHVETFDIDPQGHVILKSLDKFHSIGHAPKYKTLVDPHSLNTDEVSMNIRTLLSAAVRKRLMTHRRIGCLLSGGLDSSLVAGLISRMMRERDPGFQIQTFSIGMEGSPDLIAARKVAEHINSEHHEVVFTAEEGIAAIKDTIYHLETYDVITIRSAIAMFLVCKYIAHKTDSVVIFSGEGADELAQGYLYFRKAPDAASANTESLRLLEDLHLFDVCRADRAIAAHGLELRLPFLDHQFTSYYLSIPTEERRPIHGTEKYLIRKAFGGENLIPDEVLWRAKEGFSDGVSSTQNPWFKILQNHIETLVSEKELQEAHLCFCVNPPKTREAYYYRKVFESYFPHQARFVPYYWMPKWTDTTDPSPRVLPEYEIQQKTFCVGRQQQDAENI